VNYDEMFYGSVTVGERGQVVIPADARIELDFNPGDKLLAMRHPIHKGLILFKFQDAREFLDEMSRSMNKMMEEAERSETVEAIR
jgi:AbrB family looped-hinge helix DNA binding protein